MLSAPGPAALAPRASDAYRPRRPTETVLYRLVQAHLETFLAHARANYGGPLPRYVVDAFRGYLTCGVLSHGFILCRCESCGHDVLVGFSCKVRGLCPSCGARRMANEAAFLVDRVLPSVPVRQWVLSLPFELRGLAAIKPDVLTALGRIFTEEIARVTRRASGVAGAETGALNFPQRFGGSCNLNLHFHVVAADGVFSKRAEGVAFHDAPPPAKHDLEELCRRIKDRALRWLRKRGYLDERSAEERGDERRAPTALEACTQLALAGGAFLARPFAPPEGNDAELERKERRFSASLDGFDVHCAVRIAAGDDAGRERLLRYCARPPFALERIGVLPDGRVTYLTKYPRKGRTHRVMTPVEFLARLAVLVAPPRYPLLRFSGVFAPGSSWRKRVVPRPPPPRAKRCAEPGTPAPAPGPTPAPPPTSNGSTSPLLTAHVTEGPSLTTLTNEHWTRLRDGALLATSPRVPWQTLLKRSFGFDALRCPVCNHRTVVVALVEDRATARGILEALGLPADAPAEAPARDPTDEQTDLAFDVA